MSYFFWGFTSMTLHDQRWKSEILKEFRATNA